MATDKPSKRNRISQDDDRAAKKQKKATTAVNALPSSNADFLGAGQGSLDASLATLFSSAPERHISDTLAPKRNRASVKSESAADDAAADLGSTANIDDALSGNLDEPQPDALDGQHKVSGKSSKRKEKTVPAAIESRDAIAEVDVLEQSRARPKKRKRNLDAEDDLETRYMEKLVKENERSAPPKDSAKSIPPPQEDDEDDASDIEMASDDDEATTKDVDAFPPPVHESLLPQTDTELEKAQSTVFLGNVSISAVKSKSSRRSLEAHLKSFFPSLESKDKPATPSLVSLRFRSTPFATAIPKRAAFALGEVMEATALSTNAYAVYSSQDVARKAVRHLNGTVILDRHLRVDSVAHPAKVDHHRCVFVGNLGFVEDETNIDAANEAEGREKRKKGTKKPSDTEEGLWRTFAKCGAVESVRVVRDAKTRVGKGIAYVQFADENAVEAALLLNDKRFPPMLPRKLRVMRAKAQKRSKTFAAAGARHDEGRKQYNRGGYVPKRTPEEQSQLGRAAKLYGKAGARVVKRDGPPAARREQQQAGPGMPSRKVLVGDREIKGPESFVFEGNRASSAGGNKGLNFKKKSALKKRMPTKSSNKRAAAFKSKAKESKS